MNPPNAFPPDGFGITSTIPLEIPLAAGKKVFDLNNLLITGPDAHRSIRRAEGEGFPRTCCSWIRGLFGLIREQGIKRVIFVTGGDCSNTHAMLETLQPDLEEMHTFSYPYPPDRKILHVELERFCHVFGTTLADAEAMNGKLLPIRRDLGELDRLTWQDGRVTGEENHRWLVSSSDFEGDPPRFHQRLQEFLDQARRRPSRSDGLRLALLGVPPINSDLHAVIESLGARIVFNEIPRQFAMIGPEADIVSQYLAFTYPYGVWPRIADIKTQIEARNIHGVIHYTQAFCHRQIHDIMLRHQVHLPFLTIEGENPGPTDQRTRLRVESFLEILASGTGH